MSCTASVKQPCFWAFILLTAALAGCVVPRGPQPLRAAAVPPAAYTLRFTTIHGESRTLRHHEGKVVLLTFWAPWCVLCRSEMGSFALLARNFQGQDLSIVGVAVQTTAEEVRGWEEAQGKPPFELLLDDQGQAQRHFNLSGLPVAVVLNRRGEVVPFPDPETGKPSTRIEGPRDWGSYESVRAFAELLHRE